MVREPQSEPVRPQAPAYAALMRKPYPTDLTDEQWDLVAPLLPPARGRRIVDIREVVDAIL